MRVSLVTRAIDAAALLTEASSVSCGATALFLGTVRNVNDGRAVTGIEYAAYEGMATRELERIAREAAARFDAPALVVEHRLGALELGEVSVAIVAAHAHRANALDATRYVIEQLKARVPVWKREHYADGTRTWVDPTASASWLGPTEGAHAPRAADTVV